MKLESVLTPVSISDNQDSYVYDFNLERKRLAVKMYFIHAPHVLLEYIKMQNALANHKLSYMVENELKFQNQEINTILFSILKLPNNLGVGTFVWSEGYMKGLQVLISSPDYIWGNNLRESLSEESQTTQNHIYTSIMWFLNMSYTLEWLEWTDRDREWRVLSDNFKVTSCKDWTLHLTATDISCDIARTIFLNTWINNYNV